MKTKFLKLLVLSLGFTILFSCEKDDDNIVNEYPKEVTFELRLYSPTNEAVKANIMYFRGEDSKEGKEKFKGLPVENLTFKNVDLPFTKKLKRKVNYNDKILFLYAAEENERGIPKQMISELFVNGVSVYKTTTSPYITYTFK